LGPFDDVITKFYCIWNIFGEKNILYRLSPPPRPLLFGILSEKKNILYRLYHKEAYFSVLFMLIMRLMIYLLSHYNSLL
jgi:hypothetical protein